MKKRFFMMTMAVAMAMTMTACGATASDSAEEAATETVSVAADETSDVSESAEESAEELSAEEEFASETYEDSDLDWTECTLEDLDEYLGADLTLPENAGDDDIWCRWYVNTKIAEVTFHTDSEDYTLRAEKASEFEEITDLMYQSYDVEDECQVCGKYEGIERRVSEAGTYYDSIQWYDSDDGIMYSLTAMASDSLDGFDIQGYAEEISQ